MNSIEVFIPKALIDSNVSHDEFILINVLKEYDVKEEITVLRQFIKYFSLFIKHCYFIIWSAEKIQKVKTHKL